MAAVEFDRAVDEDVQNALALLAYAAFFGRRLTTAASRTIRKFASLMAANSGAARTASQSDKVRPPRIRRCEYMDQ